jgi:hypothetical protein
MFSVPAHVLENGQLILIFSFIYNAIADLEKLGIINVLVPGRGSVRCIISEIDPTGRFIEFVTVPSSAPKKKKIPHIVKKIISAEYCPFFGPAP